MFFHFSFLSVPYPYPNHIQSERVVTKLSAISHEWVRKKSIIIALNSFPGVSYADATADFYQSFVALLFPLL
jgi:hypothetical protein